MHIYAVSYRLWYIHLQAQGQRQEDDITSYNTTASLSLADASPTMVSTGSGWLLAGPRFN